MMKLRDEQIRALLEAARATRDVELDCEGYLTHLAAYAEARATGRSLPSTFDRVVEHERLCANCREETVALVAMLGAGAD